MKILVITISVIIVLFLLFQSFTIMSIKKSEEQKYTLVLADKEFEIRFYPAAILATVKSEAQTYREFSLFRLQPPFPVTGTEK
jgi:hypothetical protein